VPAQAATHKLSKEWAAWLTCKRSWRNRIICPRVSELTGCDGCDGTGAGPGTSMMGVCPNITGCPDCTRKGCCPGCAIGKAKAAAVIPGMTPGVHGGMPEAYPTGADAGCPAIGKVADCPMLMGGVTGAAMLGCPAVQGCPRSGCPAGPAEAAAAADELPMDVAGAEDAMALLTTRAVSTKMAREARWPTDWPKGWDDCHLVSGQIATAYPQV